MGLPVAAMPGWKGHVSDLERRLQALHIIQEGQYVELRTKLLLEGDLCEAAHLLPCSLICSLHGTFRPSFGPLCE